MTDLAGKAARDTQCGGAVDVASAEQRSKRRICSLVGIFLFREESASAFAFDVADNGTTFVMSGLWRMKE